MIDSHVLKVLKLIFDSMCQDNENLRNGAASRFNDWFRKNSVHPSELDITPSGTSAYLTFQDATAILEREVKSLMNKLAYARLYLEPKYIAKLDAIDENSILKPLIRESFHEHSKVRRAVEPVRREHEHFRGNVQGKVQPIGTKAFSATHRTILRYISRRDPEPVSRDDIAAVVTTTKYSPRLSELSTSHFGEPLLDRISINNMTYYGLTENGKRWISTI